MNNANLDPFQGNFPEVIEEYLEHGVMKCIAFNRRGTLLAAGCSNGICVIWDFETRGIAKELRDKDCNAAITSVCWSKLGHRILVSTANRTLILWDVSTGEKVSQIVLEKTPLHARLYPGSSTPSFCLVCSIYSAPLIVDLNTGTTTVLPASISNVADGLSVPLRKKVLDDSSPQTPASFNKNGDLVYLGNSKGEILIIDHSKAQVRALIPMTRGAMIKNIVFSRNGEYLLTNSSDKIIRVYDNMLPAKDGVKALDEMGDTLSDHGGIEKLKEIGSKALVLKRKFQDFITRIHWKAPGFSSNGKWVISGSASKGEHKIYIWDRAGHLVKLLEGPKESLIDLAWHPIHPIVVSVSLTGMVYIWAKDYTESWSLFSPDFKELEENEEYVEREDEFDIMPDIEKVKEVEVNQDEDVDILTVEHDSNFSDSDMSQDELCYLPAIPNPDAPDEQDKSDGNSLKSVVSNHSPSPLSIDAIQNEHVVNHESSPIEDIDFSTADDANARHLKRKRKPSKKVLELKVKRVKKPMKKTNP